ncbi:type III pantothenate kinase [Xanthomonas fragariae]|uniref:Type III pantothenate kinase n=1 Tax=Xanthomonas fragariae TaxID=48664 RepID=A0A1Y6HCS9_9XANT|nr:type III pantothenate kinase [Xanthomonas fragariae]AOD13614.1 pantothenate kinase [Xanthomonas fragariae]AOD16999.1 pantothenate kinase [Xanthomonas fragariae]ENZ95037.1 pantothenate kinase [Xanthomonas fragariae LMG 25863]MBL9198052.1 type III pantothenate kinase [Xanthomonas fragariae]MBL9222472.1 type III pantothenate kinase [Xanthomonas fragariae]
MSEWLFDLGNSRFKYAPLHGNRAGDAQAWAHGAEVMDASALSALPSGRIAHVASVAAPALTECMIGCLHQRFEQVRIVRTATECAGIRIAYADPSGFGVDRFLALLGARGDAPVLVAGVGTALTIDVLGADGQHHGGRIAASPTTMREALHARAMQLPASGGDYVELANDTVDALTSGCDGAAVALIERSLQHAQRSLGVPVRLLVHGGGAPPLLPLLPDAMFRAALVLDGLATWATSSSSS